MRSILLCDNGEAVRSVYSAQTRARLQREVCLEETVYTKRMLSQAPDRFGDVDFLFSTWGMPTLCEEEIRSLFPKLRCVFYAAGTVQAFARPFLNCGVKIFSAWAANAVPVAEYTVAQIVLANKGFFKASDLARSGKAADAKRAAAAYCGNYGAKIGILGAGMIGSRVIQMLKAFALSVLVFDPFLPDESANALGVEKTDLASLFRSCNVVSCHLADNAQTKGMLHYGLFSSMPPYATFLNTGRGAQVVESDLARALRERPDLTAVLDVTQPEPPLPDSEFYRLQNCVLTPHIAGSGGREVHRMAELMAEEAESFLRNGPCRWEVTPEMLETMA